VTALDWIIIAFTCLMGVWGYAQGLIVGALSLVGFAGGAFLGSRLGPLLLEEGSQSPYAPLFALIGALFVGGILASGLELLGFHLRHRLGERLGVTPQRSFDAAMDEIERWWSDPGTGDGGG
jgi:hypothetical protein